jgi:hypothetical protein
MLHIQNPEFHIAVAVSPEEEATALADAPRVDPEVQVLDSAPRLGANCGPTHP